MDVHINLVEVSGCAYLSVLVVEIISVYTLYISTCLQLVFSTLVEVRVLELVVVIAPHPSNFIDLSFQFVGACTWKPFDHVQEDVLGRAKKAKEQAARESMEGQGIIPKPTTVDTISANQGVSQTPPPSTGNAVETDSNPATKGPVLGVSSDDWASISVFYVCWVLIHFHGINRFSQHGIHGDN